MTKLGSILNRLWSKGYIDKKQVQENDYDLLTQILIKKNKENKHSS